MENSSLIIANHLISRGYSDQKIELIEISGEKFVKKWKDNQEEKVLTNNYFLKNKFL